MATTSAEIVKLEGEVRHFKATLAKYQQMFSRDGTITATEAKHINDVKTIIGKVSARLATAKAKISPNVSDPAVTDRAERVARESSELGVSDATITDNIKYEYKEIVANLFATGHGDDNEIHPNDVKQGYLGDCYFLAAIQAIAQSNPAALKKLIKDNGDGTYDITLYVHKYFISWNRRPVIITVNATVPVAEGGTRPIYAGVGDQELWVLLLEKAYAQYKGDYGDIEGGYASKAMGVLLGENGDTFSTRALSDEDLAAKIQAALDGRQAITASSNTKTKKTESVIVDGQLIYYSHAYNLLKFEGGIVYLQNPHGRNHVQLSVSDFKRYYRIIAIQ